MQRDIFVPAVKEPKFLAFDAHTRSQAGPGDCVSYAAKPRTLEEYLLLYQVANNDYKFRLDASTSYLYYHEESVPKILSIAPDAHIIIILRNPLDRAVSNYNLMRLVDRETLLFSAALSAEEERKAGGYEYAWHYKSVGEYERSVSAFVSNFDRVTIVDFKALVSNPSDVLHRLGIRLAANLDLSIPFERENSSDTVKLAKFGRLKGSSLIGEVWARTPAGLKRATRRVLSHWGRHSPVGNTLDRHAVDECRHAFAAQLESYYCSKEKYSSWLVS